MDNPGPATPSITAVFHRDEVYKLGWDMRLLWLFRPAV